MLINDENLKYCPLTNWHRNILQGTINWQIKKFQTGFLVAGGGFLFYCNHQLITKRIRDSDFKNKFVIMKRENTFIKFPCEAFPCEIYLCPYLFIGYTLQLALVEQIWP